MLCKGPYWKVKLENFIKKKLANPSIKAKKVCVWGGRGLLEQQSILEKITWAY